VERLQVVIIQIIIIPVIIMPIIIIQILTSKQFSEDLTATAAERSDVHLFTIDDVVAALTTE
jgi:uncharacterized protein YpmB